MTRTLILAAATAAATLAAVAPAYAQQWRWNDRGWRTIGYTASMAATATPSRFPAAPGSRRSACAR